ncbi:Type 1 glutamine amidotransferase-like domain-containing protein [Shewanella sp. UCD-KL21]|uniref:Type 1 glutamine amidotransferase-like domain-containing protein n=1 Tax=Shewanella sp. UCD-KL21 TaxID=1917164 RepID=UPI000970B8FE|nr:Type 1 glutamine amidotransferase-like domain-containing protein [Shewanella sp. UCD-KL21]
MKLALLSDGTSIASQQAIAAVVASLSIAEKQAGVVYIASEPDAQRSYFSPVAAMFKGLGFDKVSYIDLEDGYTTESEHMLRQAGLVYLSGGDTYRFLYWLKQRGVDKLLYQLAQGDMSQDAPVIDRLGIDRPVKHSAGRSTAIIGISAGAMIMTSSIDSAPLCGDTNQVGLVDTSALALVPFLYVPHISPTDIDDTQSQAQFKSLSLAKQQALLCCSDNDAVVLINNQLTEFGAPTWINRS